MQKLNSLLVTLEISGWKSKVQEALQEADRERKRSLTAHAQIAYLNKRLEPHMNSLTIYREASMYAAVETDEKTNTLERLQKNIEAILRRLHNLLEERSECIKILSLNKRKWKDVRLQDLIRNHVNHCEAKLATTAEVSREEMSKLASDLNHQERENRDMA